MAPKFEVATASFPCSPPDLNSSKLPLAVEGTKLLEVRMRERRESGRAVRDTTFNGEKQR
jgi:hypothetical protein